MQALFFIKLAFCFDLSLVHDNSSMPGALSNGARYSFVSDLPVLLLFVLFRSNYSVQRDDCGVTGNGDFRVFSFLCLQGKVCVISVFGDFESSLGRNSNGPLLFAGCTLFK